MKQVLISPAANRIKELRLESPCLNGSWKRQGIQSSKGLLLKSFTTTAGMGAKKYMLA